MGSPIVNFCHSMSFEHYRNANRAVAYNSLVATCEPIEDTLITDHIATMSGILIHLFEHQVFGIEKIS